MMITGVKANRRKRAFEVATERDSYDFPFAKLRLEPTDENPVEEVFPDPELGNQAFTYRLKSGDEDSVHLDAVREVVKDPDMLLELMLHRLTVEARRGIQSSGLGKRQLARCLGTSASQLYRLLDPDNSRKSVGQMLALLDLVERDVKLVVQPKQGAKKPQTSQFHIYKSQSGNYRFRLIDDQGRVLLSSHRYQSKNSCLRGIASVKRYAIDKASYKPLTSTGKYRFVLRAANNRAIARSPIFLSASTRDAAISAVRNKASKANLKNRVSEVGID
jgi:uncharacterized protein